MRGLFLVLLLLVGSALAEKKIDGAARQPGASGNTAGNWIEEFQEPIRPDSEERLSKVPEQEQPVYGKKSAFKSSIKNRRQRQLRRNNQRRELQSAATWSSRNASQFPSDSFNNAQKVMQNSMQFQQKAQAYAQKSGVTIPLQQKLDRVKRLPGQPEVSFAQYAGYVTVNESAGRALFYYFVEATSSPETKPLVLWLNGGPGCSSLGYGAFEELGPFHVNNDGSTLSENKYSWNKVANFLFLESPAGVGFSYSNNTEDYLTAGDTKTSYDSFVFLIKWFDRFPQFKFRDFYLAGESYAGQYVPQLAKRVHDFNMGQASPPFINLKGFFVGNAVIDSVQDARGAVEYWWTHAVISDEIYAILQQCLTVYPFGNISDACNDAYSVSRDEEGNIDYYDIYAPVCLRNFSSEHRFKRRSRFFGGKLDPCQNHYITAYFNRPDVQKAIHANVTHLDYDWELCNNPIFETYGDIVDTVIPIYRELIEAGLKIWVMSGDVDSVVPVTSTRYSLQLLKLKTIVPWHAWYLDNQVGGYSQGYDGLTLVTVRDAGHAVPWYQPAKGFAVIESYISGKSLPNGTSTWSVEELSYV